MTQLLKNASERLKINEARIMAEWEHRAKKEVAAAHGQESLALRNSLPEYLSQLTKALSTKIDRTELRKKFDLQESERVGRKHGHERAGSSRYTMDQMIFEYHILRQVICDVLEENDEILSPVDREVIMGSIEQAVNNAATQFSDTLHDIQEHLTRTLAHDLRTPITAATLGVQLIGRNSENPSQTRIIAKRVENSLERVDSMIRDLLDASRLEAGKAAVVEFEKFDLELVTNQIAEEFNHCYQDRFHVKFTGDTSGVWNKSGLSRVIENLGTNAVKYGKPDTPIYIEVAGTADSVSIQVRNSGKVISKNEMDGLFDRFTRGKQVANHTGWGLGLSVVKSIAETHHGQVQVESTLEAGTAFTLKIPRDGR